ncbi:alpha/beta hydrolase family protein [bacterium BMS3Bbin11]|nr:alpha/beta hydrolase family protein [bacterium BMS3Bbin11]GMT40670.1 MAG: alpha/beta hydrolase [bacterium]HDH15048.1 alpha/beta fold hydrolase [Gammaproteobacteria bacterium]
MLDRCTEGFSSFPVTIPGPSGDLEGIVDCAADEPQGGAVICHPHPLYGGAMQNKVVHTLAKSLAANNRTAVRFNFRGVGVSTGKYDEGAGETDDALAVLDWLASNQTGLPMILAGFSFGSYIALQAAAQAEPAALITVAPPVGMFDFENLSSIICPWLLIQGDEDEVVDANSVVNWVRSLENPPQLEIIHGSSHFFHGKLLDLRSLCDDFLQNL